MPQYPEGDRPTAQDFTDAGFRVVDNCEVRILAYAQLSFAAHYDGHELPFTPYTAEGLPNEPLAHWRVVISPTTEVDGTSRRLPAVVAVAAPGSERFIRCLSSTVSPDEF